MQISLKYQTFLGLQFIHLCANTLYQVKRFWKNPKKSGKNKKNPKKFSKKFSKKIFKKKFSKKNPKKIQQKIFSFDNSNKQQKPCYENVDGRFFRCFIILSITFDYGGILFWCYSHSRYLYSQLFTRLQRNDFKFFHTRKLHSLIQANAIPKR